MKRVYLSAGSQILILRNERGFTREELSGRASISPKFLYEIETGKTGFSVYTLCRLCQALDVSVDQIVWDETYR